MDHGVLKGQISAFILWVQSRDWATLICLRKIAAAGRVQHSHPAPFAARLDGHCEAQQVSKDLFLQKIVEFCGVQLRRPLI